MITCEGSCTYRSSPIQRVFSATASACNPSSKPSARLLTCTARERSVAHSAEIDTAFAEYPHAIHYALKANSTLALLRLLRSLGSRVDANSWGEIQVALRAGFDPSDVVFTGVGKTREELEAAIAADIGTINAESAGELDRLATTAARLGRVARVALRVNPDIDARSHPNISTGLKSNKFGVPIGEARAMYAERRAVSSLKFVGVHVHIGSQITSAEPLARAARVLVSLARELCDGRFRARTRRSRWRPGDWV